MNRRDAYGDDPYRNDDRENDPDYIDDETWVPEEALQNLTLERQFRPSETPEEMAERILKENLPIAAQSVVQLAVHSKSERIRLDAARYVIERNLGRVEVGRQLEAASNPWDDLYDKVLVEVDQADMKGRAG